MGSDLGVVVRSEDPPPVTAGRNGGPASLEVGPGRTAAGRATGGLAGWQEYRLDDCLKTVRATLARRKATLRPESENVLRDLFDSTRADREAFLRN